MIHINWSLKETSLFDEDEHYQKMGKKYSYFIPNKTTTSRHLQLKFLSLLSLLRSRDQRILKNLSY